MKNIVILGSTGSIGVNTLDVIKSYPKAFRVLGLTAYNNVKALERQIAEFKPEYVAVTKEGRAHLRSGLKKNRLKILNVERDLEQLVSLKKVDAVVIGMRGSAALGPFLSAVRAGKTVAPANKEALVVAGDIIMAQAKRYGATVVPVDSEQSAIFQCLMGQDRKRLKKVYLTASGGALRDMPPARFDSLSVEDILKHPTWKMGKKITVDSAMLMNKGFEVIEACRLFDLSVNQIEVLIHPESIIHSMVEFQDGSILAQLAVTDMRLPIQFALTYPDRWPSTIKPLDFTRLEKLTFRKPDKNKFPSLKLCFYVVQKGGTLPSVLNASDEEAVEAYLKGRIKFTRIYKTVEKVVLKHHSIKNPDLKQIREADEWAREETKKNLGV